MLYWISRGAAGPEFELSRLALELFLQQALLSKKAVKRTGLETEVRGQKQTSLQSLAPRLSNASGFCCWFVWFGSGLFIFQSLPCSVFSASSEIWVSRLARPC